MPSAFSSAASSGTWPSCCNGPSAKASRCAWISPQSCGRAGPITPSSNRRSSISSSMRAMPCRPGGRWSSPWATATSMSRRGRRWNLRRGSMCGSASGITARACRRRSWRMCSSRSSPPRRSARGAWAGPGARLHAPVRGGAVTLDSTPGVGTTVSLYFPRDLSPDDATEVPAFPARPSAAMSLPVVKDDPGRWWRCAPASISMSSSPTWCCRAASAASPWPGKRNACSRSCASC
ncbi:protein of unknown function [Rhodovastum atsumiense]|nr:protein of unknown function [Rhodovastum atsumiense]